MKVSESISPTASSCAAICVGIANRLQSLITAIGTICEKIMNKLGEYLSFSDRNQSANNRSEILMNAYINRDADYALVLEQAAARREKRANDRANNLLNAYIDRNTDYALVLEQAAARREKRANDRANNLMNEYTYRDADYGLVLEEASARRQENAAQRFKDESRAIQKDLDGYIDRTSAYELVQRDADERRAEAKRYAESLSGRLSSAVSFGMKAAAITGIGTMSAALAAFPALVLFPNLNSRG
ncbi:MAG: hypothetical protein AAGI90_04830 [Chlamydiota bacterium]